MSEVKIIGKRDAVMFSCEEGDGRRALCDLADAFSYREEPCAAKLRDAIETLDFIDLADSFEIVEDTDPLIIARAMTVLAAGGFGVAHATNKRGAFGVFALSVGGETQVANTKTQ